MPLEKKQKLGGAIKIKGIFSGLNDQLLNFIFKRAQIIQYVPEEQMCSVDVPADRLTIILRGTATIWLPGKNDSQIKIAQLGPLDAIGEREVMMHQAFVMNISADTNLVSLSISNSDFFQLLENNQMFNREMFRILYERVVMQDPYLIPKAPADLPLEKTAMEAVAIALICSVIRLCPSSTPRKTSGWAL